jgi:hypothetical protein
MSFIRATSNPEALYVYHDVGKFISWTQGPILCNIKPENKVSLKDFYGLMRKVIKSDGYMPAKCGSFSVEEAHVYESSTLKKIKYVDKRRSIKQMILDDKPSCFKIIVRNKGKVIGLLWPVTWRYVVSNVENRDISRYAKRRKNVSSPR